MSLSPLFLLKIPGLTIFLAALCSVIVKFISSRKAKQHEKDTEREQRDQEWIHQWRNQCYKRNRLIQREVYIREELDKLTNKDDEWKDTLRHSEFHGPGATVVQTSYLWDSIGERECCRIYNPMVLEPVLSTEIPSKGVMYGGRWMLRKEMWLLLQTTSNEGWENNEAL